MDKQVHKLVALHELSKGTFVPINYYRLGKDPQPVSNKMALEDALAEMNSMKEYEFKRSTTPGEVGLKFIDINMINDELNLGNQVELYDRPKAQSGGAKNKTKSTGDKVTHNGKKYTVRIGARGGRYITAAGKKVYL